MKKIIFTLCLLGVLGGGIPLAAQTPTPITSANLDYSGFVNCDGVLKKDEPGRQNPCNFAALMGLIVKMVNWLFYISVPIAAALFAYAGVLYMTTAVADKKNDAKAIFKAVAIGFIIMVSAWFIVRQVVSWFVSEPAATLFIGQ